MAASRGRRSSIVSLDTPLYTGLWMEKLLNLFMDEHGHGPGTELFVFFERGAVPSRLGAASEVAGGLVSGREVHGFRIGCGGVAAQEPGIAGLGGSPTIICLR